jgi:hypothetical protein
VFDPMKPIGGIDTVIPDLAESWSWDESGTKDSSTNNRYLCRGLIV